MAKSPKSTRHEGFPSKSGGGGVNGGSPVAGASAALLVVGGELTVVASPAGDEDLLDGADPHDVSPAPAAAAAATTARAVQRGAR